MPFNRNLYAVNFANGNLKPHVNPNGWPDMKEIVPTDPLVEPQHAVGESEPDAEGLNLSIRRRPSFAGTMAYSIFVAPPDGLTLDRRLLTRVTFDLPRAEQVPPDGGIVDGGGGAIERQQYQSQHATLEPAKLPSVPEVWGVALSMGPADEITGDNAVFVSCQFHRQRKGVRLNTPRLSDAVGPIQRDQPSVLVSPLDYDNYDGGFFVGLDGTRHTLPPALFTFEHSFCGRDTTADKYTVGAGFLTIHRSFDRGIEELRDHRVYSSNALTPSPQQPIPIEALAVTLATTTPGRMSVRLRTFEVLENPPA